MLKAALKSADPLAHGPIYGWVADDNGHTRKNKGRPTYITISDNVRNRSQHMAARHSIVWLSLKCRNEKIASPSGR